MDLLVGLRSRGVRCSVVVPYKHKFSNELSRAGFEVFSLDLPEKEAPLWWWTDMPRGYRAHFSLYKLRNKIFNVLVPKIKLWGADIVFSQTIVSPWGAISAALLQKPHVLSAREYGILDHSLTFNYGFKESITALYLDSAAVYSITKSVADFLFQNTDRSKIIVHYNNIHLDFSEHSRAFFSRKNRPGIAVLGIIRPSKGQLDLVQACISLIKAGREIDCYLIGEIGDPDYFKTINRVIRESGAEIYFHFPGSVDNPHGLMHEVDLIVCCSKMEGLGRTLFEAILLDKPIIYPNTGGPGEVFVDGKHGLAYTPQDIAGLEAKIIEALDYPGETARRVQLAKKYVLENFTEQTYVEPVLNGLLEISKNSAKHLCNGYTMRLTLDNKEPFLKKFWKGLNEITHLMTKL